MVTGFILSVRRGCFVAAKAFSRNMEDYLNLNFLMHFNNIYVHFDFAKVRQPVA